MSFQAFPENSQWQCWRAVLRQSVLQLGYAAARRSQMVEGQVRWTTSDDDEAVRRRLVFIRLTKLLCLLNWLATWRQVARTSCMLILFTTSFFNAQQLLTTNAWRVAIGVNHAQKEAWSQDCIKAHIFTLSIYLFLLFGLIWRLITFNFKCFFCIDWKFSRFSPNFGVIGLISIKPRLLKYIQFNL